MLIEKLTPDLLLTAIQLYHATICFTSPTAYRQMTALAASSDFHSLRKCVSAGEALPRATREQWKEATGLDIYDGIGGTEMTHIYLASGPEDYRPNALGRLLPGYVGMIVDEEMRPLAPGEVGRLAIRGPTGCRYLADARQRTYVRYIGLSLPMSDWAVLRLAPPDRFVVVAPGGGGEYPNIQAAIDAARDGMVVELRDGVYRGAGNRDLNLRGKRINVRSQSDKPDLCIVDCEGSEDAPHRAFVFDQGETGASVIRGLTLRNGWVSGGGGGPAQGGAVSCQRGSSPLLRNCVFAANHADQGGAIGCSDGASPTIEGCLFRENTASEGGALFTTGAGETRAVTCTFHGNSARQGGAVRVGTGGGLSLARSILAFNRIGGAVSLATDGRARLQCCDLYGNEGGDWTGEIAAQLGSDGNLCAEPMFCDAEGEDLRLHVASPCLETACGLVGARPEGCNAYYVGAAPQHPYKTIAQALAWARPGGRIVLMDSLYAGAGNRDLAIPCRGLTIESNALDPAACVLDLEGSGPEPHRAFRISATNNVTVRGITLRRGCAPSGGAILVASADSTRILDCAFEDCRTAGSPQEPGGGALCVSGDSGRGGSTVIRRCRFDGCGSHTAGGAVSLWYRQFADTTVVEECLFRANQAAARGGALGATRAVIRVSGSLFSGNSAPTGGAAVFADESRVEFDTCTMAGNAAGTAGECVYLDDPWTEGRFRHCILAGGGTRPPIECSPTNGTRITAVCCDLWSDADVNVDGCLSGWQEGNIRQDPMFCSPLTGDYRLHAASPCLRGQPADLGCGQIGALGSGCGAVPGRGLAGISFRRCVPNPFRRRVRIEYVVPETAGQRTLDISIYSVSGQRVRTLYHGLIGPGEYSEAWRAEDDAGHQLGSGVYFCRLRVEGEGTSQRLIVVH